MSKKHLIIFLSFFFWVSLLSAQEWTLKLRSSVELRTFKLTNKVDVSEEKLAGATISLHKGAVLINQIQSDGSGDFVIDVPANGDFILTVSYSGCNSKKFAISTMGVPEEVAKDNYKPTFGIEGVIMAKAFPTINYSVLQQPLARIVYTSNGKKFDDEEAYTNQVLGALSLIRDTENILMNNFATTNNTGDVALSKGDCPLAKASYEKAMTIIPGERYPSEQLPKVGDCLKQKELAEKKAADDAKLAAEKVEADRLAKEKLASQKTDADKLAKDKAAQEATEKAAKAESEKAQKDKQAADKLEADRLAKEKAAAEKLEADKLAKDKATQEATEKAAKVESEKAQKDKQAADKLEADRLAKEKAAAEKLEADKLVKDKAAQEASEKAAKAENEKAQKDKQAADKLEADKLAKDKTLQETSEKAAKVESDRLAKEKASTEKLEADKLIKDKAAQVASEKIAKAEAEKVQKDKQAKDKTESDKVAKSKETPKEPVKEKVTTPEKETTSSITPTNTSSEPSSTAVGSGDAKYSIPQALGSDKYKSTIKRADELFKMKRYTEAKTMYEDALKQKPNDLTAINKLAEIEKLTKK